MEPPPVWLVVCPEPVGRCLLSLDGPPGPHGHPVYQDCDERVRAEVAPCGLVYMIMVDGGQPYHLAHLDGLVVMTGPDGRVVRGLPAHAEPSEG
ncbi:DUF6296 family protein [Kitasatospora sp. NPDC001539]|uniref:DUF6296 family protein n=1 Tax=unclassified Kitasatospora TaxID=2633591 RepID=UPI003323E6DB